MGLLDVLVPTRCAGCGAGEELLCPCCRGGLRRLRGPLCARCGAPTAWPVERCVECAGRRLAFASARGAVAYEGAARTLVAAWKERGLRSLGPPLADLVVEVVPRPPAGVLAFVPGDPGRSGWRGHNAAEGLARLLAVRWELPVAPLLERAGARARQRSLTRSARRANVRGAFRAEGSAAAVALVDDVFTTGATAGAAASALRAAGTRAVHVVSFARAVRR